MFIYSAYYYFNKTEYITDAGIWFQFKIIIYAIFNIMLGIVFYNNMNKKYFHILICISFIAFSIFILLNIDYSSLRYKLRYQLAGDILPIIGLFIIFLIDKKI